MMQASNTLPSVASPFVTTWIRQDPTLVASLREIQHNRPSRYLKFYDHLWPKKVYYRYKGVINIQ